MNKFTRKRTVFVTAAIMLALSLGVTSCATVDSVSENDAIELMVDFDQAYIPFLAMTSKGDEGASNRAMDILLKEWAVLEPDMRVLFTDDDTAQNSISEVDAIIMESVERMAAKEPLIEIHEILEGIKSPLVALRKAHNIAYYPDLLDEYHTIMEEMLGEVSGKDADHIDAAALHVLQQYAEKGQEQLNTIASADFNADLYRFSADKTESLRAAIQNAQNQEARFLSLVKSGDTAAILEESAKLKGAYTQVYLKFGNFERLTS